MHSEDPNSEDSFNGNHETPSGCLQTQENVSYAIETKREAKRQGRPRLNPDDDSARERRRTQVRLAQRAFRQRKDTTIATLEDRVKELERINLQIVSNRSLYDGTSSTGLVNSSPQVPERLECFMDESLSLSSADSQAGRYTSPESDNSSQIQQKSMITSSVSCTGSASDVNDNSCSSKTSQHPPDAHIIEIEPDLTPLTETQPCLTTSKPPISTHVPFDAGVILQPTYEDTRLSFHAPALQTGSEFNRGDFMHPQSIFSGMNPLRLCVEQVSFSHRLKRRIKESGLSLALMENPPPDKYAAVFGHCLLYETRQDIIQRLVRDLNDDSSQVDIEMWSAQIKDSSDNSILSSWEKETISEKCRIMLANHGNEFLKSEQVEIYLLQLGINIYQSAEYIDAVVDISHLSDFRRSQYQKEMAIDTQGLMYDSNPDLSFVATASHNVPDIPPTTTVNMSGLDEPTIMPLQGSYSIWTPRADSRLKVGISVKILTEELISSSVCLGREPSIRRNDVNRAIKLAAGIT